jgi:EpsI family protein
MPDSKGAGSRNTKKLVIVLTIILAGQIAVSRATFLNERTLGTPELARVPSQISHWSAFGEQTLEPEVAAYLRPDDYISRSYQEAPGSRSIDLFVAYFKSLQNSQGPHSPRNCLPGSGWLPQFLKVVNLPIPAESAGIPVNEYLLEKNGEQILVVYWYQNDRRVWAEEFEEKLYLLRDLVRYRRSDVSLVRIVVPVGRDGAIDGPLQEATRFAGALWPFLVERFASVQ